MTVRQRVQKLTQARKHLRASLRTPGLPARTKARLLRMRQGVESCLTAIGFTPPPGWTPVR